MTIATAVLSVVAGMLTALSPCVLPALPLVVGSAATRHHLGPLALAAGLTLSFTVVGVALATVGPALGVTNDGLRLLSAALLLAAGIVMLTPALQHMMSSAASPLATAAAALSSRTGTGLTGQFALGALLGAIWSPCVGPTLGAAIGLASSGGSLTQATATMLLFGLGSSIPLLATAYAARGMSRMRLPLLSWAHNARGLFGVALVAIGLFVITGIDRRLEAAVLDHLPLWWINLLASA
jgi:cytochrome c-type biogenesis protein